MCAVCLPLNYTCAEAGYLMWSQRLRHRGCEVNRDIGQVNRDILAACRPWNLSSGSGATNQFELFYPQSPLTAPSQPPHPLHHHVRRHGPGEQDCPDFALKIKMASCCFRICLQLDDIERSMAVLAVLRVASMSEFKPADPEACCVHSRQATWAPTRLQGASCWDPASLLLALAMQLLDTCSPACWCGHQQNVPPLSALQIKAGAHGQAGAGSGGEGSSQMPMLLLSAG